MKRMRTCKDFETLTTAVVLTFVLFLLAPGGVADGPIEITEWEVPWPNTRPRDPSVAPDGSIFFVGQRGNYVGQFDPKTAEFKKFDLEKGAGPHNQIIDKQGNVWYAGNKAMHIGKLDPKTGAITKVKMPNPEARDPHTMVMDDNGTIWFTVQGGNFVGQLDPKTEQVRLTKMLTPKARPYGILIDDEGYPWFAQFGTNKIGRMEPDSMEVRSYELPNKDARDRRIARTSDGMIWYTDYSRGYLGRLDPESGDVQEWAAPSGDESRPYGMAVDDKDRIWFVETGPKPNNFVGFDPKIAKVISVTPIKSGGGAVRHMVFDPKTRAIWFGTDSNMIGRASIPQ